MNNMIIMSCPHFYANSIFVTDATEPFLLRKHRDLVASKAFFRKALKNNDHPKKIMIDKSGSNIAALKDINKDLPKSQRIEIRQIKYLNNIIEQDHRFIKKRTKPMLYQDSSLIRV